MKLSRQEAIALLFTDEVYEALDLREYYIEQETRYISLPEILGALGVDVKDLPNI